MPRTGAATDAEVDGAASSRPKRADAVRNIEAIVEAATRLLAVDPDVSVNEIAREAGVGRITLYGHFDSRAALVHEVADRAIAHTEEALAHVDIGGDPREALGRLMEATWHLSHRFGALVVAATQALSPEQQRRAHGKFRVGRIGIPRGLAGGSDKVVVGHGEGIARRG